jgi:hypothetical protein
MFREPPGTGASTPIPFSFEHAWEMKEADFLAFHRLPSPHTPRTFFKLTLASLVGLLLLFAPYSAMVGVLLLLVTALVGCSPRMMKSALKERYAASPYLHGPVAYGVSRAGIWIRSEHFGGESVWEGLVGWREQDDWLILSASGMPPVYLPIGALKEQALYDPVLFLARAHGQPLGAPTRDRNPSDVPI